jgi:hypothetical protein
MTGILGTNVKSIALATVPESLNTVGISRLQETLKTAREAHNQLQLARLVLLLLLLLLLSPTV